MNKLRIGVSMLCHLGKPFKYMVESIPRMGASYVEIVDDGWHELDKRRVRILNDVGASHNVEYSVHAPFSDMNIASPSKPMLNAMLRRLEKSIVHARDLSAHLWVFHPGLKTGISSFYPNMDWIQNLKTVKSLCTIARKYGVRIAIENVPEPYPFLMKSVDDFNRFYAELDDDVGLVLDVGHSNINRQTGRFLETFKNKIVHIHLSDNDGKSDQHLGIGFGSVDWTSLAKTMEKMSFDGVMVVECVENVEMSVARLKDLFD